jgi:phosphatidylserine/phosphatidylglycerophosphate/cardiolipin synthase-like enzyme
MLGIKGVIALLSVFIAGLVLGVFMISVFSNRPAEITGNQVLLLTDRDYFREVHQLLSEAERSIHMVMFDVKYYPDYPESLVNSLLSDLADAASRGADVRVITDEYLTEKPVVRILKENGIDVKFDSKEVTTHSKLIIIDSQIVIVGSTNWGYHSIERNHEANVIINSASLAGQFEGYFERVWAES